MPSVILRPEYQRGLHFTVRKPVLTYAGQNEYTIDSDFGIFEATGNTQLVERVQEIAAIAKVREISRTDEYKKALAEAAKSPLLMAKNLATDPVKTVTGVPKGIWKFMNRAGQSIKEIGEKRERSPYEDGAGADAVGFSKAKRELALKLGVDPYSSNPTLQKDLNGISWAAFAGNLTVTLALAPIGGGAGAAITGLNISTAAEDSLRDNSPSDLRRASLARLLDMDVPREDAVAFLNATAYSPTNQTLLVEALTELRGARGRDEYVRLAAEATDETDAIFFRRSAQLMARVHREHPLAIVSAAHSLPVCLAQDGTVVVPLEWDYACWTQRASQFLATVKGGDFGGQKITGYHVFLTGVASPKVREELAAADVRLTEKALPGPLQ
ncbi:MAG: hypothetical protein WDN28_12180 [Chthoniobacter sp.]